MRTIVKFILSSISRATTALQEKQKILLVESTSLKLLTEAKPARQFSHAMQILNHYHYSSLL